MKPSLNCLVVDDDPMFSIVAESVLQSLSDGRIATAANGRQGLALLTSGSVIFDVVFLDLNMPDLDGLAFLRAAAEAGFKGRIVISSGEAEAILRSAQTMGQMLGISIAGAIRKPLKVEDVRAILEQDGSASAPGARAPHLIALSDGSFDLTPFYQPQYDLLTGAIKGLEALIRLKTRDGQIHGPSKLFDSITDQADLTEVSIRIAEHVLADIAGWRSRGLASTVSINFDAAVLEQPAVVADIRRRVEEAGIDPMGICLEVTEKSLPKDPVKLIESLTRLRMAGFHISLDDYGTGASNFELLRLCPFSELKLDRSIIAGAVSDPVTRAFMRSSAQIARDLALITVAEGVETETELQEVRAAGMDRVQGFLFSRPLPASAVPGLLSQAPLTTEAVRGRCA